MKKICVTGAGGFIGGHLVSYLKKKKEYVIGIDIKYPEFNKSKADKFIIQDLRYPNNKLFEGVDEVYHLAANMGGIGYIKNHNSEIIFDNTLIDMFTINTAYMNKIKKFFYASSACVYPLTLQNGKIIRQLKEEDAYPANAEDAYGWEKLLMEMTCQHFRKDYGLQTYIARFHNIYGTMGTYKGGKEKSPAALCRKIAEAKNGEEIEIWGDGQQIRSYCYVDDCVEAIYKLMQNDYHEPMNIGTEDAISIDYLANMIIKISKKDIRKTYNLSAPQGVRNRNADITKANKILNWSPKVEIEDGIERTYNWIKQEISQ